MLVNTKKMLKDAQTNQYAIPAFNIENMEMAQAVINIASELCSPVILQTTQSTLKYAAPEVYFGIVNGLAKNSKIPVALHLDHAQNTDLIKQAIAAGYTSVMFDGSNLAYEENVRISREMCEFARKHHVFLETELGSIGGKEDNIKAASSAYTDPNLAKDFTEKTKTDSLAIAIGTAHGFYQEAPIIDVALLEKIHTAVEIPLVLHGASGLDDVVLKKVIAHGITKINFATELRVAFSDGVKEYLLQNPKVYDPKQYLQYGRCALEKIVMRRIQVCGSANASCETV